MTFDSPPPSRPAIAAAERDLDDAEFAELDSLLASVPEPLDPLDAVMLDGFLCGVVVQPALLPVATWMPFVFDAGGHRWGEAEASPERARAEALVSRRLAALHRDIAEIGAFRPYILEPVDEPGEPGSGDAVATTLAPWSAGFAAALSLFPLDAGDADAAAADEGESARVVERIVRYADEGARASSGLDAAIDDIVAGVVDLYDRHAALRFRVETVRRDSPKVGRNDPCPCGSGRKFKHCHGAAAPS